MYIQTGTVRGERFLKFVTPVWRASVERHVGRAFFQRYLAKNRKRVVAAIDRWLEELHAGTRARLGGYILDDKRSAQLDRLVAGLGPDGERELGLGDTRVRVRARHHALFEIEEYDFDPDGHEFTAYAVEVLRLAAASGSEPSMWLVVAARSHTTDDEGFVALEHEFHLRKTTIELGTWLLELELARWQQRQKSLGRSGQERHG